MCNMSGWRSQDRPVGVQWRTPNHEDLLQRYSGRVQTFDQSSPGNLSVLISDLTEEDGGTYSCWINQNQYRNFSLTVKDCKLSETQEKDIHKYPGESVLLPCSCSDQRTIPVSVKWEHVDSGGTDVSNETELYKGRVQMFNKNLPANLSLLISNLTEQDQGTYRCSINNKQSINIRLSIKGCTLSETQEKLVFRSPGQSVLLPCSCTDQRTKPVSVKWEHVGSCGTEVSNETPRYTGRVQMFNKNLPANLSLLISNLTEQDQGTYRCSINNKESINIKLSITAEKREISDSSGSLIPWIVCVALLFIVIGQSALIYKLLHNRTQGSASTNTERGTQNIADDDYENDPSGARNKIRMAAVYQSLDPNTNQSDSVYQGLNPNTNQSDSVYQSLNPNTSQSDSVYQSLNPNTNQSDSVYQSLNPNTIQSD
uniref:Ig-like domain-containing protein n=1 Tax=Pygocentrus nattereri TaxID=42514 RepID=A0AAR2L129_PYGNA